MQEWNVICYKSQKLKEHENNYTTHDLELVAIVHKLKVKRHYVMGRKFELWTNHLSLKYPFNQPNLNSQQARWLEFLCELEFNIKHIKGKENKVACALSRMTHVGAISTCRTGLRSKILIVIISDEFPLQVKEGLLKDPTRRKHEDWRRQEDGLLLYKDQLYVLDNAQLGRLALDELHQMSYLVHPGYYKTMTMEGKSYFYLGMKKYVA